ncbi:MULTISPECIES: hypothetical protein [Caballeronia]|uniref:Uncharacterized protein n=1 Tax=Caballeronia zhejiangensis TaxID=871203 RepID=A0A656QBU5_9BURK|nr:MULTISPECIES: hypothetical protein [Caballeronia]EKS71985.1 hypothetical protein BURK_009141 [Burkholderia sp. SJ98]KDR25523.1 hypothetical protein BG60_28090 [Caballeronia zhejiangensis]
MLINNDFEIGYVIAVFSLLGIIFVGALFARLHLERWHPRIVGAVLGALIGFALIEAVPIIS